MRLQVSRMTDLAVRAMRELDARGQRVAGGDLADAVGTSRALLPQVLTPVVRRGWATSTTGPGGGYDLVVELDEVSVLDVVEAVEGPVDDHRCVLTDQDCPAPEPCALHDAWSRARQSLREELQRTSLRSLAIVDAAPRPIT